MDETVQRCLSLGVVVSIACVNLVGLDCVTATQSIAFVLSLAPCLIFAGVGLPIISVPTLLVRRGAAIDWALLLSWAVWLCARRHAACRAAVCARASSAMLLPVDVLAPLYARVSIFSADGRTSVEDLFRRVQHIHIDYICEESVWC